MEIINKTKSLCAVCGKLISAEVYEDNGRVFMRGICKEHGEQISDHVWDDPEIYRAMLDIKYNPGGARQIIVDLTKKCNLNCSVCFANANHYEENHFLLKDVERLSEYKQIFLSGGEPTMKKGLFKIIRKIRQNNQSPILFTNGIKLANRDFVRKLAEAGLRSVLLQFDTLKKEDSEYIRGGNYIEIKKKALKNLAYYKIPTSIWTVMVNNRNLNDIKALHQFFFRFPNVKTVSAIPIWRVGRYREEDFVPPSKIIEKLNEIYGLKKSDFASATRLVCNLDRLFAIGNPKKSRLFGKCMVKALALKYKGKYVSINNVFNLKKINKKVDAIFEKKSKTLSLIGFSLYFLLDQLLWNFIKNKYFRAAVYRLVRNLKHLPSRKYLLLSPFNFITVGIFPNAKNIDLNFIEPCNSYALDMNDYSFLPACLRYIYNDKKIKQETRND